MFFVIHILVSGAPGRLVQVDTIEEGKQMLKAIAEEQGVVWTDDLAADNGFFVNSYNYGDSTGYWLVQSES